ncbi:hypothetical protein [Rubidibacter lacunae]|nr:hypothetical protein [Rubidibacter lacunae]
MTIRELLEAAQELSQRDRIRLASELMQLVARELEDPEPTSSPSTPSEDPFVGLFSGSAELATQAEEIRQQELQTSSGFTWKAY